MKKYVFEITIDEHDIAGDEFWEECIQEDYTGIVPLKRHLQEVINEHLFNASLSDEQLNEQVILKSFTS